MAKNKPTKEKDTAGELVYTVETVGTKQEPLKVEKAVNVDNVTLQEIVTNIESYVEPIKKAINKIIDPEVIAALAKVVNDYRTARRTYIQDELEKPEYEGKPFKKIEAEGTDEHGKTIPGSLYEKLMDAVDVAMLQAFYKSMEEDLQPFLQEELQKPEYGGRTLEELRADFLATNEPGLYEQAMTAAEAAQTATQDAADNQQSKRPKKVTQPLSKLSTVTFMDFLNREGEVPGQLGFANLPVKMESGADKRELTMLVSIQYPETADKRLTPTDNRIYNATSWLQTINGSDMTYSQIARAAGWKKPNAAQLERVKESVEKMRLINIEWNNKEEAAAYKKNDKYVVYKGYLYPVEVMEERKAFNGKLTDAWVRVLRPLPVMEFAKERGEIATIPATILESDKIKLTDINIAMQDYLIKRIERQRRAAAKKKSEPKEVKVLYETLYKNTGANTRQKKRTLLDNLYKYLEELKDKGYITDYKETTTKTTGDVGVVIKFH